MKKMWSEEEVTAAIAEYAATHPAGGKLFLHNVSFYDDNISRPWHLTILSTEKNSFTDYEDIIGKVISVCGAEAGNVVFAIACDDMNLPAYWYISDTNSIEKVSDPTISDFADVVTAL